MLYPKGIFHGEKDLLCLPDQHPIAFFSEWQIREKLLRIARSNITADILS